MGKCLKCIHWKPCFSGKEWDAAVGDPCEYFATIEAEPVRHGRWVSRYAKHWKGKDECGECGFHEKDHRDLSHMKYCPNCGAKMDLKGE